MAKKYIEQEAAIKALCNYKPHTCSIDDCNKECQEVSAIYAIPAADVRPVVLCRDCKWCHAGYCEKYDDLIPFGCANKPWEDWFCADGKKREEADGGAL